MEANATIDTFVEFQVANAINLIFPPILITTGTIFNILVVLVMRTDQFRNISTSVYMTVGAINDCMGLLISLIPHWMAVNFPASIIRTAGADFMCKFFMFYGWGNCDYGIMVMSAMTVDRAFAISFPLKSSSWNLPRKAKYISIIICVIVMIKESHFLFVSDVVPVNRTEQLCIVPHVNPTYDYFWKNVWPWIHIGFLSIALFSIIISNCVTIKSILKSQRFQRSSTFYSRKLMVNVTCTITGKRVTSFTSKGAANYRSNKSLQITLMLLLESFALILLTYPFSCYLSFTINMPDLLSTDKNKAYYQLIFSVTFYCLYSNKCVNFVLFALIGSRFRKGLRHVLRRTLCCKNPKELDSNETTLNCSERKEWREIPSKLSSDYGTL